MTELKTTQTDNSVDEFLNSIADHKRSKDCLAVVNLMKTITKAEPKMWGTSIVGFGSYHYRYESGREADWFLTGFSPRAKNLTLYIMSGFRRYDTLMKKLGKHKTGKSCLHINDLDDIDMPTLKQLVKESVSSMKQKYR